MILQILFWLLPWNIRRFLLKKIYHFEFSSGAKIGFSIILAKKMKMGQNSSIGHFTICKKIDYLEIGDNSGLGNNNRITGFSVESPIVRQHGHFSHIKDRKCEFVIGNNVGITSNHYFDCNGGIYIGDFVQIAGLDSIFMTHSIDLKASRQDAESIHIGSYTFVGARVTILKGSSIGKNCIVGAGAVVGKKFDLDYRLIGGVPAHYIKSVEGYKFFERKEGFVK